MNRYSFEPIDALFPGSHDLTSDGKPTLANTIGVATNYISRWRRDGLDTLQADRVAIALGYHPANLWPSWFDDAAAECCVWCGVEIRHRKVTCGNQCAHMVRIERRDVNLVTHRRRAAWWRRVASYRVVA